MENELRIWTDGTDTYVATTVEHAMLMQRQLLGENPSEADAWGEDTRAIITILDDDAPGGKVTKTRDEWIADNGPGFLCSTEW